MCVLGRDLYVMMTYNALVVNGLIPNLCIWVIIFLNIVV